MKPETALISGVFGILALMVLATPVPVTFAGETISLPLGGIISIGPAALLVLVVILKS